MNRMISDTMLNTAVAMYNAAVLIHFPSVTVISKLFLMGVHEKIRLKKMLSEYPAMKIIVAKME